ncbi:MAG: hypothetical protein WD076_06910 [Parvularculaceae bacterium]
MADGADLQPKKGKKRPRIAFTGEEFGFGYQAVTAFINHPNRRQGFVADGGYSVVPKTRNIEDITAREAKRDRFEFNHNELRQPLRTKEQALLAVKSQTADFALVPFYSPYFGYDFESLRALSNLFGMLAVEQYEATDQLCLAVHESQVLELAQSSHPASGLSALLRDNRAIWAPAGDGNEEGSRRFPDYHGHSEAFRAGLKVNSGDQMLLRDRIDIVFAGPEAARRCKSKLDGLRGAGVEVAEIPQSVEPHREMAKRARASLTSQRQVSTFFDPKDGKTHYVSQLSADQQQTARLFGVVLPFQVADMSSEYIIVDPYFEDAEPTKTRFFVGREAVDETLIEDAYKTTDARTRYWERRLAAVSRDDTIKYHRADPVHVFPGVGQGFFSTFLFIAAAFAVLGGVDVVTGVLANRGIGVATNLVGWVPILSSQGVFGLGAVAAFAFLYVLQMRSGGDKGVRLMVRFQRSGDAASLGDVEGYLRNFGVSHAVVRIDEDSERDAPAAVVLDIEFEPRDFGFDPWSSLTNRLRGSVVNGALKKIFQRWKSRSVSVLAAMPFDKGKGQMPKHKPRRWWSEGVEALIEITVEEWSIRAQRVIPMILLGALLLMAILYGLAIYFPDWLPSWIQLPARN